MALPTDTAGPFDVKVDDLIQINATQAVDVFRQLLIIEATMAGIPITGVDVPAAINVADGGIDAVVTAELSTDKLRVGLISPGLNCYQIKTGSFSASTKSDIRSLLVQPKYHSRKRQYTKDQLQPRVLSCFEKGGSFIVVLFGSDLVGPTDNHGEAQIRTFITSIDPDFDKISVRIIRANQLCSAIKALAPGIALQLNRMGGCDNAVFDDLSFMAECCYLEVDSYMTTDELNRATEQITRAANEVSGFQHIRVLGDAGAGKTHLIYRALSASQLKGCVLYCRDPEESLMSGPIRVLTQMASTTTIILVADECDFDTAEELTALFKRRAANMLLVTTDNVAEPDSAHANTLVIDVPRLEQPVIAEIFKGYGIPNDSAMWLATLCEGSPRAAHRLGFYIQCNPDQQPSQQLTHLDKFWDRIVCAPQSVDSGDGRDKLVVIRTLALFRQVAWDTTDGSTVQRAVLELLQKLDRNFSHLRLSNTVDSLRKRRVLQGHRTMLISPKLLHIAMWKSWFEHYANGVDVVQFRAGLNAHMQEHFDAMLIYVQESRAATALANRLMSEGGPFATLAGYNANGGTSLFFAIAQADPKAALRRFAAALGGEKVEVRKEFTGKARRTAIHRLEQLAVSAETFFEAADCLLMLAEAENENWSNNSTGIFVSMFSLGYGPIAASELSPIKKTDYLRKLLRSDVSFHRKIAVQALSESLKPFMSRTAIDETIGLRRLPDRWKPKTYEELYTAYTAHVALLEEAIGYLPVAEASEAAKGILLNVRSLILIAPLTQTILAFLRSAAAIPGLHDQCIETVVATLHYEGKALAPTIVTQLETIRADLTESSFSSKLRRYAGMRLIEDNFDAEGNYSDAAGPELLQLSSHAVANPELIVPEFSWLITYEAKNGFQFGQLLGHADQELILWRPILSAWGAAGAERSDFFIGGYLSAWHDKKIKVWEQLIEELFPDLDVRNSLVGVIQRSGMSDHIAETLLAMAQEGSIDAKEFRQFVYGNVVSRLPLPVVTGVIDLLVDGDDVQVADAALDILYSRLRGQPEEISVLSNRIERVLSSSAFIKGTENPHSNNMLQYRWNEVANRFLAFDTDAAARLAVQCINHFGNKGSITSGNFAEPLKFLTKAAREKPDVVWSAIAHRLAEQFHEAGSWRMLNWLRGNRSLHENGNAGLEAIPTFIVFNWIDVDVAQRAPLLAENCPPAVSKPNEPPTFARLMLERYGELEQVRRGMHANNFTEGWSGAASEHYRSKLASLDAHLGIETNNKVRIWLQELRTQLERSIEQEAESELDENER